MKRREALELVMIAAAPIAGQQPHQHTTGDSAPAAALRFLLPEEFRLVDRLTEMIIPADARSPGAREARVAAYIDEH